MAKDAESSPGLYVHIPFCLSRCSYCAFSTGLYDSEQVDRYLNALARELSMRNIFTAATKPATLFIGGGTPSSLSSSQLEKLLSILPFPDDDGEATCEINPDSLDMEKLSILRRYGINRCSFGVQTFSGSGLKLLGRRHDSKTAVRTIARAIDSGMPSVSLDLISGWPGQSLEELITDLRQANELGVTHISCYNLMVEEGSRFRDVMAKRNLHEKDDVEMRRFWDMADSLLVKEGFIHYETSNFARPGFACRHNMDTWKGKEYLGIGSAAHSHLGGRRFANTSTTESYIESMECGDLAEVYSEVLDPVAKAKECAVFWLRLLEGIDCAEFRQRTGFDLFELYAQEFPALNDKGFICTETTGNDDIRVKVRREMHPVLDSILVDLV